MNILFIHQNFPGQFVHLSADLAMTKGTRVVALTMRDNPAPANVAVRKYSLLRNPSDDIHPMLRDEESKLLRAEACAAAAFQLNREGFEPDLIIAHPGWGEALFMKDVFPHAKLVIYCEYYYAAEGQDVGFDPEDPPLTFQHRCRIRLKNTTNLLSLEIADAAISPTEWQKSTYPAWAQEKIQVVHDGIDLARLKFNPKARITLRPNGHHDGLTLKPNDEVLTYVARNLEPVRGFHVFMRSLPDILRTRPNANVVIVGGDKVSYGRNAPGGISWREHLMNEVGGDLDPSRVHFIGTVSYKSYVDLLSVSKVHAYLTSPFVLSWSFIESAMSGVPVIASATQPVEEFAELATETVPFFDTAAWSDSICNLLAHPSAPRTELEIPRLTLKNCLKQQKQILRNV